MSVNITPSIQHLLDAFTSCSQIAGVSVSEVAEFVLNQIEHKDVISINYELATVEEHDDKSGSVIVRISEIDNLLSFPNFASTLIEEVLTCGCHVCVTTMRSSHDDVLDNQGKPTFYVDYAAKRATRIKAQEPEPIELTAELENLINLLKTISGVTDVWVEKPLSNQVYATTTGTNPLIFFVDHEQRSHNKYNIHQASDTFLLDESMYSNVTSHPNILESIKSNLNYKIEEKAVKQQRLQSIFDKKIFRAGCLRPDLYDNQELNSVLDRIFSTPEITNRTHREIVGNGLSFAGDTGYDLANLSEAKPIVDWITTQIGMVRKYIPESLSIETKGDTVVYQRSWSNRLFKGASALTHRHLHPDVDLVAVFYVKVPNNSGDIIFIRNGQDDVAHTAFPEADKVYVTPEQGELILHTPDTFHAVGENLSDEARICFVFDIKLA